MMIQSKGTYVDARSTVRAVLGASPVLTLFNNQYRSERVDELRRSHTPHWSYMFSAEAD
jgi:hypothetical protein